MSGMERIRSTETVIASLDDLNRTELTEMWIKAYGRPPFKGASRKLLIKSAAYQAQSKAFGGLKRSVRQRLMQIASGENVQSPHTKTGLQPGMRLIREWHGTNHTVDVTEEGFVWNGKTYQSLSAIAKAITGAHWSGPRFFQI